MDEITEEVESLRWDTDWVTAKLDKYTNVGDFVLIAESRSNLQKNVKNYQ